ncbi:peptidyl-tRNA hydrolase [Variovorax boronicumulans]|uniref:hypothetical protein n=1 Tax=Variovorax boronicumulans TaxID=436515 RepID=UPI00278622D2|nr:hypothetical protein [Variovorax boronicumulans]MDP9990400.1 peptidyl-tRNA hydrolase [Variovorax boronicumulans]MDQ0001089.1 peptidyl-tRNA hydrolase [Variovorax boronicumulans]
MNETDLQALIVMVAKAVHSEDDFLKVWGVILPFFSGLLVGLVALGGQIYTSHRQRAHEKQSSDEDSEENARRSENELKMWNIASQRKATAKVAQMRQVWINNLRKDGATYLTLWQEISYRWDAMVTQASSGEFTVEQKQARFDSFLKDTPKLRKNALELRLRIELYLNPSENESKKLIELMDKLEIAVRFFDRNISTADPRHVQAAFRESHVSARDALQVILSNEWKVVKRELGVLTPSAVQELAQQ